MAAALAADLWDVGIAPDTVLTIALVAVTVFYAIQNQALERQTTRQADTAEREQRRALEVLDVQPLLAPAPRTYAGRREAKWEIQIKDRPVLNLHVNLRAMGEAPDPGSTDGRSAESGGLGSYQPGSTVNATIPLGRFLGPGQGWHPFEDVWQTQLTYHGMLGQWVVETYDWRIAEQIRDDRSRSWWQL